MQLPKGQVESALTNLTRLGLIEFHPREKRYRQSPAFPNFGSGGGFGDEQDIILREDTLLLEANITMGLTGAYTTTELGKRFCRACIDPQHRASGQKPTTEGQAGDKEPEPKQDIQG